MNWTANFGLTFIHFMFNPMTLLIYLLLMYDPKIDRLPRYAIRVIFLGIFIVTGYFIYF
ncbi:hypothetical protein [Bacillus thuringiensis]|uniref:hypothetical protein n=1 Tax=Bacillus thuringiensis TaxID=1428 RepID=UPI0028691C24|nr:hypothetical protein [Bacillus thuringiensis]